MFEIKPMVAQLPELGTIDIHAVIMSLKSGMKMEMANALNTLTMLTVHTPITLVHCDDLLDALLDILDQDFFGYRSRTTTTTTTTTSSPNIPDQLQVNYADLFDMSLDEMKSLIPTLEDSTSEIWLSLRERCLCILNLLRNLSFIPNNVEYLAKHGRFVDTLLKLLNYTRGIKEEDWDDSRRSEAWFVGVRRMDTLDHRKSVLMIFSNIGVNLKLAEPSMARAFVRLLHDFLTNGPDTYYSLLACETLAKIAVGYENQKVITALVNNNPEMEFPWIEDIWAELTTVIRKDYFTADGRVMGNISLSQLAALEMVIMGLYDIILIIDDPALKDQLLLRDKSAPMTIIRLCITLGESGNQQFSVVTRRGMELVRGLLCGGDGIRPRKSDPVNLRNTNASGSTVNNSNNKNTESTYLSPYAHKVLDVTSVREKLVQAMLMKSTDMEVLADLIELLDLIENENITQLQ
ncbi:hypothetical protein BC941DRAFT_440135 [Chlamydoabsidia padenii]|nr:hypothetical protein BC941DRAFT_440135 [Chlamydoabsidia padenii]